MRYFIVLSLFLSACSTVVPVHRNFPEADPMMLEPAATLEKLPEDTTELDKLIQNAADNYGKYRELAIRHEMWQKWYQQQKENFEKVK
jgi:hypothetical protein